MARPEQFGRQEITMAPLKPATLAAQALGWIDAQTKAITPPIHLSTTFIRDPDNQYRSGYAYARPSNPTFAQPEALLAALENGAAALTFASGMSAATATLLALRPGDHIVAPRVMYWALRSWMQGFATDWGLVFDFVDASSADAIAAAAADIAHAAGARLAVDSTVATPVLTRPIELGADIVMHAATKYLNGHSDVVGGALITAREDE